MPDFEFDVDASIAAGWDRFAARLAELLRDLVPGATFDLAVPVLGSPSTRTPYVRFTAIGADRIHAEVSGGGSEDSPEPLGPVRLEQLVALGWGLGPPTGAVTPGANVTFPVDRASEAAHLVAGTMERVFGIPHPVFLHDVSDPEDAARVATGEQVPADADFRSQPIATPDEATRALESALSEVYERRVTPDEHDVFTVPAGCVLLFVRAHRSLPLVVFRSPLVSSVEDPAAAETEVAILNRDSLWCRYVFDGTTISAEAEFVDRVFVPVNFKIQLAEISAELDDVYSDLAHRVAGRRWRDLRAADDHGPGEQ
ncbi:MAG: TY-Chap domain-containing protein [Dietzia sp.]